MGADTNWGLIVVVLFLLVLAGGPKLWIMIYVAANWHLTRPTKPQVEKRKRGEPAEFSDAA